MANNIQNRLNRVLQTLNNTQISQEAYRKFVEVTPIKTGNAKRNTKLNGNEINADYQYANVLDKGRHMTNKGMRGSDQAPDGMTKPTIEHVRSYVFRNLGIVIR